MTIIEFFEYLFVAVISGALCRCGYKQWMNSDNKKVAPPAPQMGAPPLPPNIMEPHLEMAPAPAYQWVQDLPAPKPAQVPVTTPAPIYQSAPPMSQGMYQQFTPHAGIYDSYSSVQYPQPPPQLQQQQQQQL